MAYSLPSTCSSSARSTILSFHWLVSRHRDFAQQVVSQPGHRNSNSVRLLYAWLLMWALVVGNLVGPAPVAFAQTTVALPTQVDAFGNRSCVRFSDGSITCWGSGVNGELGIERSTFNGSLLGDEPNEIGEHIPRIDVAGAATQIVTGSRFTCALLTDGSVKCWGSNGDGQLGQGSLSGIRGSASQMGVNLPAVDLDGTATQISAGFAHVCALLTDGSVKCWGKNDMGQLGQGHTNTVGDDPNEMGANLPAIDLGGTAVQVSAGLSYACALLTGGTVKCWGSDVNGVLGQGDSGNIGDEPNEMGANLPAIDVGGTVTKISTGGAHNCVILDSGALKCWGTSRLLGNGVSGTFEGTPDQMGTNLPVTDLGGTVTQVVAARNHTCALLTDGSVKCWGRAEQLGQGLSGTTTIGNDLNEMANLPVTDLDGTAIQLASKDTHTCALLSDRSVKCWGDNDTAQLGQGHDADKIGDDPGEMGSALVAVPLISATQVNSTNPAGGAVHVAVSTPIQVTFNGTIIPASLTVANLKVWGSHSGPINGTWSASGAVATFTPSSSYRPGEVVSVSLISGGVDTEDRAPLSTNFNSMLQPW